MTTERRANYEHGWKPSDPGVNHTWLRLAAGLFLVLLLCATQEGVTFSRNEVTSPKPICRSATPWTASVAPRWLVSMSPARGRPRSNAPTELSGSMAQGVQQDYTKFLHSSQQHNSLSCAACHQRDAGNTPTPHFPGHKACTSCHLAQFVTPAIPMCVICHSDVQSGNPPLRTFPASFKESFNVRFDHAQHLTGSARPQGGCQACHIRARGAGLTIPTGLSAHLQCYSCHTPSSRSAAGRDLASCGVCHEQKSYTRTTANARSFRFAFSHAKHGTRERLQCAECHKVTAGAAQSRQVSSPAPAEHFPSGRGMTCRTCHDGRRSFGGDLGFDDCRRCHSGTNFRMPI